MNNDLQLQLAKMKRNSEERDAQKRAKLHGYKYLSQQEISVSLDALKILPKNVSEYSGVAIIEQENNKLAIALEYPNYSKSKDILNDLKKKGFLITIYVVSHSTMQYILSYYRFIEKQRPIISNEINFVNDVNSLRKMLNTITKVKESIIIHNNRGDISNLLQVILIGGIANRASDIHFEPMQDNVKLRFRIDGMLNDVFTGIKLNTYSAILSRIKLLSNLKLNIKSETQDGRFTINFSKKESVNVRVSIAPSEFGEVIVLRLLNTKEINLRLTDLGLRDDDLSIVIDELSKPNGMILNTGPTGSGKTTTLYAFLNKKKNSSIKIITIEDPIEYQLEGIEQTQVNPESGYTFASGLKSLMRQDPDVILVGEIRDKETAEIAVQAALTGHLIFSTVHANEASAGIPRLIDLGVKPISLAPALNVVIAQRLVRRLCDKCKVKVDINKDVEDKIYKYIEKLPDKINKKEYLENINIYKANEDGCEECNGTGYKGRIGIFEIFQITPNIQELIIKGAGQIEIKKEIDKMGFVSMQQDGVLKVASGITSFEEVERVTGKINWQK